jgi:MFS family permease
VAQERTSGPISRELILSLYLPATMLAFGHSMVAPVIPALTKSFDVSLSVATLVFVAIAAGAAAATFPAGYLMDRIGRRPVLLSGPILMAAASFMTPFSHSFVELLVWRFLAGAAEQLWQQARLAIIADTAPTHQRARQMQWMTGMTRAGQLFGPAAGGFMAAALGLWLPFIIYGVLTLLAVIPSFKLIKESAPERQARSGESGEVVGDQGWGPVIAYVLTFQVLVFFVVQTCAQLARGGQDYGSLNLYAVYAYDMGPGMLGLLNTAAVVAGIPIPFLSGYVMDRWGRRSVIVPGFMSYAFAVTLMSLTAFFPLPFGFFLFTYVLVQATQGTTGGTMQVLGADLSPTISRGRFFAIWRSIAYGAGAIAPAIYGFIAEHISYGVGFLYLGGCALVVAFCVGRLLGDTMKRHDQAGQESAARARPA